MLREYFLDEIILTADLPIDDNAPRWARYIDEIDTSQRNGWMFIGEFIPDGTVEVAGKPRLILAQSSVTSDAMRSGFLRHFALVILLADGGLRPTGIKTDDQRGGWALRIRDHALAWLSKLEAANQRGGMFSALEV